MVSHIRYCIFEVSYPSGQSNFVMDFYDYSLADDMMVSMNNLRKPSELKSKKFVLRCLNELEFANINSYNPLLYTVLL